MKRRVVVYLFFVASGILFFSCLNRPNEVLNRRHMERLMYDVYIAEALMENDYQNFDTPEKKEAYIQKVFEKHRITQAEWDTSLSWYSDRIDLYMKMNDSVKSRLERERKATEKIMALQYEQERAQAAFSYSASYIPKYYSFNEIIPKKGFRFNLDSIEVSKKADDNNLDFSFDVHGIPLNTVPRLQAALILEYKDTTIYRSASITENRSYILNGNKYIPDDTIVLVTGFVKLQDTIGIFRNIRLNNIHLGKSTDTIPSMQEQKLLMRESLPKKQE